MARQVIQKSDVLKEINNTNKYINFDKSNSELSNTHGKVRVTDLLSRMNEEKKIEKKRNLALGVAAVSAVTVFGIILTI